MARRVGFGEDRAPRPQPSAETPALSPGPEAEDAAPPPKKGGRVGRIIVCLFMLVWLALWSFGIISAWDSARSLYDQPEWEVYDYALMAFFAVWLGGALLAWAFGLVILFVMAFGQEVDPNSPERIEKLRRWRERREGRAGRKDGA